MMLYLDKFKCEVKSFLLIKKGGGNGQESTNILYEQRLQKTMTNHLRSENANYFYIFTQGSEQTLTKHGC